MLHKNWSMVQIDIYENVLREVTWQLLIVMQNLRLENK